MKPIYSFVLILGMMLLCTACSIDKTDSKKMRDVDFTVMDPRDIPEELSVKIKAAGKEPFNLTYGDGEYLYIAVGYGEKETSGYSVEVPKCYETKNSIYIKTNLLGPQKGEEILEKKTCPFAVVKMEYTDKNVEFD